MFKTAIIIIIVLIILVLIWWAVLKSKRNDVPVPIEWPPQDFMKELGGKCPDYWTYLGDYKNQNINQNICENTYGIHTKKSGTCAYKKTVNGHQIIGFPAYKQWPPTKKALNERCKWIRKCGHPKTALDASWIGMDKVCSNNF